MISVVRPPFATSFITQIFNFCSCFVAKRQTINDDFGIYELWSHSCDVRSDVFFTISNEYNLAFLGWLVAIFKNLLESSVLENCKIFVTNQLLYFNLPAMQKEGLVQSQCIQLLILEFWTTIRSSCWR